MQKILVLSGSSNSGKTNTLQRLAILMSSMSNKYSVDGNASSMLPTSLPVIGDGKYVFVEKTNGQRIGIATGGDTVKIIDDAFKYFVENNCDIVIVASKSYGSTVWEIERHARRIGIKPLYFWLIWNPKNIQNVRDQDTIQCDISAQLESII